MRNLQYRLGADDAATIATALVEVIDLQFETDFGVTSGGMLFLPIATAKL